MKFAPPFTRRGGLAAVAAWLLAASSYATPLENLKAPSQEVRDEAAAELRQTWQSTPEARWRPVVDKIKNGQTKAEILELLGPYHITRGKSSGRGETRSEVYYLDSEWVLRCDYLGERELVVDWRLDRDLRGVWVEPPPEFTGAWIVYFPNGQKSFEIQYKNGEYDGDFISFHADGSKWLVQHYVKMVAHGPDTGYHPSGKVLYRGEYRNNKQVGTWRWFDEAGNLTVTKEMGLPVE